MTIPVRANPVCVTQGGRPDRTGPYIIQREWRAKYGGNGVTAKALFPIRDRNFNNKHQ